MVNTSLFFILPLLLVFLFPTNSQASTSHKGSVTTVTSHKVYQNRHTMLLQKYRHWKGTRYRLGGHTHKAIDCSALTQRLFKEAFNVRLPRTTWGQLKRGKHVSKQHLKVGDLVFFRTSRRQQHVGIYIGDNRFIHASRRKGVTISTLKTAYWSRHFLTGRQILLGV
ncbi:TPA: hypothetical protein JG914_004800 [Enterobacter hormaechei subsp. steigerwaltii]|nr:hypothetical protein [Enterobacter hormaechei subsp. steigerwaltii]